MTNPENESAARRGRSVRVSIVVPVYNEEANLEEFLRRILAVMDGLGGPYEIVLVDDGSRDRSLEILKAWSARRPDVLRALQLSRNFGQHPAILAAFRDVTGDVIVTLDADLQNPPEEIPKLLAKFDEGYDVVGGVRRNRQDSWPRRFASGIVNRATVAITRMRLTDFGCMLRAYSRDVVDEINRSEEASTFIPALGQSFARNPTEIEVAHAPRRGGESAYSLYRLIRLNFDLMTGFSTVPLEIFGLFGMIVALGGILFGVFLLVRRLIVGAEVEGVFTLFAILFTLVGVAMAGLGIVGEYVGRIYEQVRGRPRFSVRGAWGLRAGSAGEGVRPLPVSDGDASGDATDRAGNAEAVKR
jgi:undecaprenyl-phosphate 4-deoxy-4-formamido-L-arabinose transferase